LKYKKIVLVIFYKTPINIADCEYKRCANKKKWGLRLDMPMYHFCLSIKTNAKLNKLQQMNIILSWNILLSSLNVLDNSTIFRTVRELRANMEKRTTQIMGIFTYYHSRSFAYWNVRWLEKFRLKDGEREREREREREKEGKRRTASPYSPFQARWLREARRACKLCLHASIRRRGRKPG